MDSITLALAILGCLLGGSAFFLSIYNTVKIVTGTRAAPAYPYTPQDVKETVRALNEQPGFSVEEAEALDYGISEDNY